MIKPGIHCCESSRISESNLVSNGSSRCSEGDEEGEDIVSFGTKLLRALEIDHIIGPWTGKLAGWSCVTSLWLP